jgi:hypothetical protein
MADFSDQLFDAPTSPKKRDFGKELFDDVQSPNQPLIDHIQKDSRWGMTPLDLGIGFLRGASNISGTIPQGMKAAIGAILAGEGQSGAKRRYEEERQRLATTYGAMTDDSVASKIGTFAGEVAGTAGTGNVLANTVRRVAPSIPNLARAIESGGFGEDIPYAARVVGGAIQGGASTAMIDPNDAGAGATLGAVLPGVVRPAAGLLANLAGKGVDYFGEGLSRVRGGKLLRGAAGPDQAAISQLWQNADPSLTAAQAAADAGRYEMSALGKVAQMHNPSYYGNKGDAQVAANLGRIERAGGSDSAAAALEARTVGGKAVETALGPEREMLLDIANVGAEAPRMLKEADTLRQLAIRMHGMGNHQASANANARATVLEQRAADVQKKYSPLDVSNASDEIHRMIDDPKLGSSENVKAVLSDVNNQIQQWVNKGEGVIDAHALYGKRKTAIGETVDRLLAGNPQASKELSAKLATRVKAEIDASLNAVTGGQWSPFLTKYSGQLGELGQNELMDVARKMYAAGDHVGFMNLIKNESPETVRKIMTTTDNINTALPTVGLMGPSNKLATLQNVGADITRNEQLGKQATEGADALYRIVANQNMKFKIPGMISRTATIGNAALATIESRLNAKTMDIVTEAMKNGQSANDLMALLPAHERNAALMWIANGGPANYIARTTGAIAGDPNK